MADYITETTPEARRAVLTSYRVWRAHRCPMHAADMVAEHYARSTARGVLIYGPHQDFLAGLATCFLAADQLVDVTSERNGQHRDTTSVWNCRAHSCSGRAR